MTPRPDYDDHWDWWQVGKLVLVLTIIGLVCYALAGVLNR